MLVMAIMNVLMFMRHLFMPMFMLVALGQM